MGKNRIFFSVLFLTGLISTSSLKGATWNVDSGAWDVPTNWTLPPGVPNAATTDVIFPNVLGPGPTVVTIPGTFAIQNIQFTATTESYSLTGGTLNVSATAGNGISAALGQQHVISSNINVLSAAYTITTNSADNVNLSGVFSGSATLAKAGTGEVVLSGTNSNPFSGAVTINAGTVKLNKTPGATALAGGITINAGTLLWNQSNQLTTNTALIINNAASVVNLNSQTDTIGSLTVNTAGTYTLNGTLGLSTSGVALSVGAVGPTINGTINLTSSTGGSITKAATGTLTLQNLGLQNGIHDINATGAVVVNGVMSGNGGFNKLGASTLTLGGSSSNTYTGQTVVSAGTLTLSKTVGVAIGGDCNINGGIILSSAAEQFSNASNLTITTGTYNMNSFPETLNSLNMIGGSIINNTVGLTLISTQTALEIRNVTVPGQLYLTGVSGGDVIQSSSAGAGGTLTNIDLGSVDRHFMIADTPPVVDTNVVGIISGTGGVMKNGIGTLQYSGTGSNSYTGLTTISQGTLLLNKTAPFIGVQGNIKIDGGVVQIGIANQISDSSNVTIDSGTFNLNNLSETIGSLTFNGGVLNQGSGILSLASTSNALSMRNTTVSGTINLVGGSGGSVVFDDTNGGMAYINNISMGNVNRIFQIAGGDAPDVKMMVGNSSGGIGGLIKEGPGLLQLIGAHSYPISTVQVVNGTLQVDGNLSAASFVLASGGKLSGLGTITSNCNLNGTMRPGNSIGTIHLIGNQAFGPTFILETEVDQTSADLVNITGSLVISPGATVNILPLASSYNGSTVYTIVQASSGIAGQFSQVVTPLLFYNPILIYSPTTIQLQIAPVGFEQIVDTGNGGVVARYLDSLHVVPGSDLALVENALRETTTATELEKALFQLQPSPLKGIALTQENNLFRFEDLLMSRLGNECLNQGRNVWITAAGDYYHQRALGDEKPFISKTFEMTAGIEGKLSETGYAGTAIDYSSSRIDWKQLSNSSHIDAFSLALFGKIKKKPLFINTLLMGGGMWIKEQRHIKFTSLSRRAHGTTTGAQFLAGVETGFLTEARQIKIVPHIDADFIYMKINQIKERGANSINLNIRQSFYSMLKGKVGLMFNRCFKVNFGTVGANLDLSYIREERLDGKKFTAGFEGLSSFVVNGMNPSRNGFSPALNLSLNSQNQLNSFEIGYKGEMGKKYNDQTLFLQGSFSF